MRLMRIGQGPTLELFQVEGAEPAPPAGLADRGLTHLGLYVDDIGAAAARLEASGGELLSAPHPLSGVEDGEGNAGAYGRTPWGMLVELITYPARISYPPGSAVTRWTPERVGGGAR
ncbi:VOC family protein [Roseomonas gilardii]|uniref:VOC family protein n=1 Tax=Roseomonas gilardii TaxID=257708 RepID=UPI0021B51084|nr:VOC family protein [Roseomonas gilardii]